MTTELDKDYLKRKAHLIHFTLEHEELYIPVGEEWIKNKFSNGIVHKEIRGVDDNNESTSIVVTAEKGSVIEPHYHNESETILCTKGKFIVTIGKNEVMLDKGMTFNIPKNEIHMVNFIKDSELIVNLIPKLNEISKKH